MDPSVRLTYLLDSPTYGGAERYLIHLLGHLPDRYTCTVVATEPVPRQLACAAEQRGRLVVIQPVGQRWDRELSVRQALRDTRPDLVHANLIDPRSNRVLLTAAAAAPAAVATVHMTGDVGTGRACHFLGRLYARLATAIAVSGEIAELLVREVGIPAARVEVVRVGVERADPPAPPPRPAGVPLVVGGLGRLTRQKGFDVLIDATRRLVADGQPVEVTVAGDGRERDRLAAAAAGLPVRLVGFCDDVDGYLAGLDVFCLPSRAEGLAFALLEATMARLPCVASAVGEIPVAVGDGVMVVPPDDVDALTAALRRLLRDPAARGALARRGATLVRRRFDVSAMVARTQDVYDRALASTMRR